ncbi:MAG: sodium-translocating pyrophosphatase [Candidatus Andersenbacteria bacterium]
MPYEYWILIVAVASLVYAALRAQQIAHIAVAHAKAKEIAATIRVGAMTFLNREYRILGVIVAIVAVLMWLTQLIGSAEQSIDNRTIIAFIAGSFLSAVAGNIGMRIATVANVRTAEAVQKGIAQGLNIAFTAGSVAGLAQVGLVVIGITGLWLLWQDPEALFGFGFGASMVGLFARVGGGIYTKAADVGADLVGKIEQGIPEDDPRNPAVIADAVGDNVGDVAGMGADLFETYVDTLIAAMALGLITLTTHDKLGAVYPLIIAAIGIIASIIGTLTVRTQNEAKISSAMSRGIVVSGVILAAGSWFVTDRFFGEPSYFYAVLIGLAAGMGVGLFTEYFTSNHKRPVQRVAEAAKTGAATNIISGLALGMRSTAPMVAVIAAAILLAFSVAGMFGVAMAGVGMLSILGIVLAADTYGPVADNAAGIAEMAGMGQETRERAEALDAVGNTTAAIGKGFAVGSAVLTAVALLASYIEIANIEMVNIVDPRVMVGLFLGGMLPFVFAAFLMEAVGKSAITMVNEVRRQFREIPGLMAGTAKPDYSRCVDIATTAALREMIVPGVIAVAAPVLVGTLLGAAALGGMLGGAIVTGFLVAITMANAGGAWDNAKKYVEAGNLGGKGSDVHKAAVVGDTVGDPCKDTAGPSVNVLIKLMSVVALVIAPLL